MPTIFGTSEAIVVGYGTSAQPPVKPTIPPGDQCTDTFNRTVSGGWGQSTIGPTTGGTAWAIDAGGTGTLPPDIVSVSPGAGRIYVDQTDGKGGEVQMNLPVNIVAPLEILVKASMVASTALDGFGYYIGFGLNDSFGTGPFVGCNVYISNNGPVFGTGSGGPFAGPGTLQVTDGSLNPSVFPYTNLYWNLSSTAVLSGGFSAFTLSHYFWVRLHWDYSLLAARAWWDGSTEPASWQAQLTPQTSFVPSPMGLEVITDTYNNTGAWQDSHTVQLQFVTGCPSTQAPFDTFTRTVTNGWGTASSGLATWTNGGSPTMLSVNGTMGVMANTAGAGASVAWPHATIDTLFRFQTPSWSTSIVRLILVADPAGADLSLGQHNILFFIHDTTTGVDVYRSGLDNFTAFSFAQNTFYLVRIHADLASTTVKVWADGTAEPGTWTVTNSTAYSAGSSTAGWTFGNGGFSGSDITPFNFDYIA